MRIAMGLLVVLMLGRCLAWAWEEPAGFRDIPWGSSPTYVKEKLPDLSCHVYCAAYLMISDIRVGTVIGFDSGGMDLVMLYFSSDSFPQIKGIFLERYGQPTARRNTTVQNRMGAQFENETLEWNGAKVSIMLEKYSTKVTESTAIIETGEGIRVRNERLKQKAKAGKKDL
jgi:hypothetical protein